MSLEIVWSFLPWLLLLACPLLMLLMMRGMHENSCSKPGENEPPSAGAVPAGSSSEQEIRLLKERLALLEARSSEAASSF